MFQEDELNLDDIGILIFNEKTEFIDQVTTTDDGRKLNQ